MTSPPERGALLKDERQRRILDELTASGRVVATELQTLLDVSPHTIRRDLDELAEAGRLVRVHGGALARSSTAITYEGRQAQGADAKRAVARAAATMLVPGQVVIVDGGSTALALVDAIPPDHTGTFVTHSPPVAAALARLPGAEVVVIGGRLEPRAMVAVGAQTVAAYRQITADVCFLGVWSIHAEHGISQQYPDEADVRRTLLERANLVVGLAHRDKLGTVAPFVVGPADSLTHLATERDAPEPLVAPFRELGVRVLP
ncbi:DeoR/GlpR transcriptional regulator [Solirubrobacter sp. CPCC 204708]|uniref:Lactose phosphotransferase system repressor n=1 Tax=Solirubrobacter deserti TaxID=2282478 RepID=A0ABT4RQ73_9ACTN|nr:DeoR/GlpR family DNA-binding transcription regulator [Solirubrobacter deserti]MBE2320617.1 DeoR/GlpR transcriptional regulator [Solirubrobacter deserti]MDA0140671.1 DeoR/GlpR family DNA-binding transcription regulator [Solirubrobacter deserti]